MDSVGLLQIIQELTTGTEHYRNVKNLTIASMVIMIFDWLLTFEMEVSYIWKAPWNVMKILYILSRYTPFVDVTILVFFESGDGLTVETCRKLYLCAAGMYYVGMGIASLIFTLRTWVVWDRDRNFGISLTVFYSVSWLIILVPFALYLRTMVYTPSPIPRLFGCIPQSPSTLFSVSFAVGVVFDTVMLLLMVIRAFISYRSGTGSDMMRLIYRDGIIYYGCVFILSFLNFFILLKLPKDYADLLLTTERVLHSVMSCRVILHIRQQG
ncbi:hypothetical protein P691DRAFT_779143, partial [Macrolepiota fuliginosa MF-IS2]